MYPGFFFLGIKLYIILYNIFLLILLIPFLIFNIIHSLFSRQERLAYLYKWAYRLPDFPSNGIICFHGVSAGEVAAIKNLLPYFKDEKAILITTTSLSGFEMANKLYSSDKRIILTFFPLDFIFVLHRFFNKAKLKGIVLVETEIWPNLIYFAKRKNIPVFLVSGRLDKNSARNYKVLSFIFAPVIRSISKIFVQSELDYNRFYSITKYKDNLELSANIKLSLEMPEVKLQNPLQQWQGNLILIFASSHKGEDDIILDAYKEIKNSHDNIKLIIAPRHINRKKTIAGLCKTHSLDFIYRTDKELSANQDVMILDTMGELIEFYSFIDIAIIGGSFISGIGGHNPIEAAYYSKAVIIGPYAKNIQNVVDELIHYNGIIQIPKMNIPGNLKFHLLSLIKQAELRKSLGENAKAYLEHNKRAAEKAALYIHSKIK